MSTLTREWQIYRAFNAAGELLYVGQTSDMPGRMRNHRSSTPWWGEVDTVACSPAGVTREEAVEAERIAIRREEPRYNVQLSVPRQIMESFRLPPETDDAFRKRCQDEGKNKSDVLRELVERWLEEDA